MPEHLTTIIVHAVKSETNTFCGQDRVKALAKRNEHDCEERHKQDTNKLRHFIPTTQQNINLLSEMVRSTSACRRQSKQSPKTKQETWSGPLGGARGRKGHAHLAAAK